MLEPALGNIEIASKYLSHAIIGVVCAAVGVIVGRWMGKKKRFTTQNFGHPGPQNRPMPQPFTRNDFDESLTINQIGQQLNEIERKLIPTASLVQKVNTSKDRLSGFLVRLRAINGAIKESDSLVVLDPPLVPELAAGPDSSHSIPATIPTFTEEFTRMYNAAREDRNVRNEFWAKFQLLQLGNRNTSDQRLGRAHEADFRTAESIGDFIAAEDIDSNSYLVVPGFTISVDDTSFRFGGLGTAYECDFTPGSTYQNYTVETPAMFSKTDDAWAVKSKGKLLLNS